MPSQQDARVPSEEILRLVELFDREGATPAAAFSLAERICDLAFQSQGGVPGDPDIRYEQETSRERRGASSFERLYCHIRYMADDFHREALKRRIDVTQSAYGTLLPPDDLCDASKAIESTFGLVFGRVADWDY